MGNQICCEDLREEINPVDKLQKIQINKQFKNYGQETTLVMPDSQKKPKEPVTQQTNLPKQNISVPQFYPYVKITLDRHRFFEKELSQIKPVVKTYGRNIYQGEVDKDGLKPHGWGKMFQQDGSLFIGRFQNGKAEGEGAFIFPDGSFYEGYFVNNAANCSDGRYESSTSKYKGGFKNNFFDGVGKMEYVTYIFEGTYSQGKKTKGSLKWKENNFWFEYQGTFNQNEKFDGKGVLVDELGIYKGDFVDGMKEGTGEYIGNNGITYKGGYKCNKKEGEGIIYNADDTVAYKGEFKNGLPHGKGTAYINRKGHSALWIEGIDARLIQSATKE